MADVVTFDKLNDAATKKAVEDFIEFYLRWFKKKKTTLRFWLNTRLIGTWLTSITTFSRTNPLLQNRW